MSPSGRRGGVPFVAMPLFPFMLIGLVCLVYGGTLAIGEWRFLNRAVHANGTVVAFDKWSKGDYPIVRYEAPNGQSVRFKSRIRRSSGYYSIEQPVGVLYDPADPTRAEIDSADARIAPLVMPLAGGACTAFCLACIAAVYYWGRRQGTS